MELLSSFGVFKRWQYMLKKGWRLFYWLFFQVTKEQQTFDITIKLPANVFPKTLCCETERKANLEGLVPRKETSLSTGIVLPATSLEILTNWSYDHLDGFFRGFHFFENWGYDQLEGFFKDFHFYENWGYDQLEGFFRDFHFFKNWGYDQLEGFFWRSITKLVEVLRFWKFWKIFCKSAIKIKSVCAFLFRVSKKSRPAKIQRKSV